MLRYLFASLVAAALVATPAISQEKTRSPVPQAPASVSPNKVTGLELPADQTVGFDEGFIPIQAQCKGDVKWLVVSQVKVKYVGMPGNSIIISVPPQGGVISVFGVGLVDGKLTEFARTNVTVRGGPNPPGPNPPGPNPPGPNPPGPNPPGPNPPGPNPPGPNPPGPNPPGPNPPGPNPPGPNPPGPNPPGPNPQGGPLHVTFVVDLNGTTPELAQVLNSQNVQQAVRGKGNFLRLYDMKSPVLAQRKLDTVVQRVGGSAVMIIQNNAGQVLAAVPIPRTEEETLAIISRYSGGR